MIVASLNKIIIIIIITRSKAGSSSTDSSRTRNIEHCSSWPVRRTFDRKRVFEAVLQYSTELIGKFFCGIFFPNSQITISEQWFFSPNSWSRLLSSGLVYSNSQITISEQWFSLH